MADNFEENKIELQDMWRREAIRFDPAVLAALQQLWVACDADGSGDIDVDEFKAMFRAMWAVLHDEAVDGSNVGKINAMAETEFAKDCGTGATTLDEPRFKQSWFQLADTWSSPESTAAEYASFLEKTIAPLWEDKVHRVCIAAAKQARRAAEAAQAAVQLAYCSLRLARSARRRVIFDSPTAWAYSAWDHKMHRVAGPAGKQEKRVLLVPACLTARSPSKPEVARSSTIESPRVVAVGRQRGCYHCKTPFSAMTVTAPRAAKAEAVSRAAQRSEEAQEGVQGCARAAAARGHVSGQDGKGLFVLDLVELRSRPCSGRT
jgi:hypothetical protein